MKVFSRPAREVLSSTVPAGADIAYTTYDSLGRVQCVENPYRGTAPPTCGQTGFLGDTYVFDALNRITQVKHADLNTVSVVYGGISPLCSGIYAYGVTTSDEVGNKRQLFTDALGRRVEVDETDPSTGHLTLNSCYGYDALNNLTSVSQGSQTGSLGRNYSYDGLSRVLTAQTPSRARRISITPPPAAGFAAATRAPFVVGLMRATSPRLSPTTI